MTTRVATDALDFQCQCGLVAGAVNNVSPRAAIRFVCHCDDCQASALILGHPERLDEKGGTAAALLDSSKLSIHSGLRDLAAMRVARLATRPVVRWYCSSCRTPLFNTYDTSRRSFFSFLLANCEPAQCDRLLGPSTGHAWTKYARGDLTGAERANLAALLWRMITRQVSARLSGDYRNTPLFDPRTGRPIVPVRIVSPAERRAAMEHSVTLPPVQAITPILNVSNIPASIAWFEKLGWRKGFVWPDDDPDPGFGSVCTDKAEIFLCRGAQGSRGTIAPRFPGDDETDGVWMSWWLPSPQDVDRVHTEALAQGMIVTHPPTDEPWQVREFHLRHPDGHMFRVSAGLGERGEH